MFQDYSYNDHLSSVRLSKVTRTTNPNLQSIVSRFSLYTACNRVVADRYRSHNYNSGLFSDHFGIIPVALISQKKKKKIIAFKLT